MSQAALPAFQIQRAVSPALEQTNENSTGIGLSISTSTMIKLMSIDGSGAHCNRAFRLQHNLSAISRTVAKISAGFCAQRISDPCNPHVTAPNAVPALAAASASRISSPM
jgi:hypothetical protein